jgi:hypothetical protein
MRCFPEKPPKRVLTTPTLSYMGYFRLLPPGGLAAADGATGRRLVCIYESLNRSIHAGKGELESLHRLPPQCDILQWSH